VGIAADTELDQGWICKNTRNHAPMRHPANRATRQARNWIRAGVVAALAIVILAATTAVALACEAEYVPPPCNVEAGSLQTDQYMDPWRDVALSLDPATRDRHAYAGSNPVGRVDTDGHRPSAGSGNCAGDRRCEVGTVVGGGHASGTTIDGATVKPVAQGPQQTSNSRAIQIVQQSHNAAVSVRSVAAAPAPASFVCGMGPYGCHAAIPDAPPLPAGTKGYWSSFNAAIDQSVNGTDPGLVNPDGYMLGRLYSFAGWIYVGGIGAGGGGGAAVATRGTSRSGTAAASIRSVDDVLANPHALRGVGPDDLQRMIGNAPGWEAGT
jgi:hypothetical protein